MDKFLSELEMKLQLMAEDASAALEDDSAAALARVPRAARESGRLRDESVSLRAKASALSERLGESVEKSAACVSRLAAVGAIRERMEDARGTLAEAAGLSELLVTIDPVLASGDAPAAAAALSQMRRAIGAVVDVPQFADARQRLAQHEDRLEAIVSPQLSDAIASRDAEATKAARGVLESIGRGDVAERLYVKARLAPALEVWASFGAADSQSFCDWLPAFYEALLAAIDEDAMWVEAALPGQRAALVPRIVCEGMEAVSAQFATRISKAAEAALAANKPAVDELVSLRARTHQFAEALLPRLKGCAPEAVDRALCAVDSPYLLSLEGYAPAESEQLQAELRRANSGASGAVAGALASGVSSNGFGEAVAALEASVGEMAAALERSIRRCVVATGLSEADESVKVADRVGAAFVAGMMDQLASLRTACAPYGVQQAQQAGKSKAAMQPAAADEAAFEALVQGALALLSASSAIASRLAAMDAAAAAQLRRGGSALAAADAAHAELPTVAASEGSEHPYAGAEVSAVFARLRIHSPGRDESRRAELQTMLAGVLNDDGAGDAAQAAQAPVLPMVAARAAAFEKAADALVYDVLASRVHRHLDGYAKLSVWEATHMSGEAGAAGNSFDLPTFSAYPQACATAVGEYLLTLPQQFEPLLGIGPSSPGAPNVGGDAVDSGGAADDTRLASEWVVRVAGGAASLATSAALAIEALDDSGAAQLAADMEYLANVVSALGVDVPAAMRTLLKGASAPAAQVKAMLADADGADAQAAAAVLKMRAVAIETAAATGVASAAEGAAAAGQGE